MDNGLCGLPVNRAIYAEFTFDGCGISCRLHVEGCESPWSPAKSLVKYRPIWLLHAYRIHPSERAPAFIKAEAIAVAVGGNLASKALMAARDYAQITENAERFIRIVREARNA